MEELDFSVDGMIKMQLHNSDKISGWLMYETSKVRRSLLDNLKRNPEKGKILIRNFCFLVKRNLLVTDKLVFFDRWNHSYITELFYLAQKTIDSSLVEELNASIQKLCANAEDDLLEAYQDQKIDPFNTQKQPGATVKKFSDFLISNDKELLAKKLKVAFGGKKGKKIAIMIIALEKLSLIAYNDRTELFNAIRQEFGNIGYDSGINDYLTPYKTQIQNTRKPLLANSDIQPFVTMINGFSD